ncbi:hypothetical protein QCD58_004543 [Enterobacter hormaechei]|nr:hypothetical protein [Enterobacter hormaechei]
MNMPNFKLTTMIGKDFETCRAAGYSYRKEMTHAVMGALTTPENWDVNGEYRSEFGGLVSRTDTFCSYSRTFRNRFV